MCMGLVAIKVWIRLCFAFSSAFAANSMSFGTARAREHMVLSLSVSEILEIASKSPGLAAAKPASIISTPNFSNCKASLIFSSMFIEAPGLCSPSLKVVSKILIISIVESLFVFFVFKFLAKAQWQKHRKR